MTVRQNVSHDKLLKGLVDTFRYRFFHLLFPEFAVQLDSKSVHDGETQLLGFEEMSTRYADLVYKARLKTGEEIIVHIEGQNQYVRDYNKTVFIYNSRLYEKYKHKAVISLVIYGHNAKIEEPDCLQVRCCNFDILDFHFLRVQLRKLDWRQFKDVYNPVAAALMSKMAYRKDEKIEVKLAHLKILSKLDLSLHEVKVVMAYFDTYLKLSGEEKLIFHKRFREELGNKEGTKMIEYMTSYHEEGIEEGKIIGREEGKREGKREGIVEGRRLELRDLGKILQVKGQITLKDLKEASGLSEEEFNQLLA